MADGAGAVSVAAAGVDAWPASWFDCDARVWVRLGLSADGATASVVGAVAVAVGSGVGVAVAVGDAGVAVSRGDGAVPLPRVPVVV